MLLVGGIYVVFFTWHLCSILHEQMKQNIISRMRVAEMLMDWCGSCWLAARDRCKQCLALLALDLPLSKLRGHRSFDGGTSTVICFVTGGELATWWRILVKNKNPAPHCGAKDTTPPRCGDNETTVAGSPPVSLPRTSTGIAARDKNSPTPTLRSAAV